MAATHGKHKAWTNHECAKMKAMAAEGARVTDIAISLGRHKSSVLNRAKLDGVSLAIKRDRWSADEIETLQRLCAAGADYPALMDALPNRTYPAIATQACYLRLSVAKRKAA